MKSTILLVLTIILLVGCTLFENNEEPNNSVKESEGEDLPEKDDSEREELEEVVNEVSVDVVQIDDEMVVNVAQLMELVDGTYEFDEVNRTLVMEVSGREFYLVYEVPVLEVDGEYLPTDEVALIIQEEEEVTPYVTVGFLSQGLETEGTVIEEENTVTFLWEEEVVQAWSPRGEEDFDLFSMSVEEMIEYLSFLERPIEGAGVSTVESHLPGAPRPYRHGTHEGIDWYTFGTNIEITTETPIYAMGPGVVVRVDHDFVEYESAEVRNLDLQLSASIGLTPEYILDRLRGKQVWVQYENGVMNRFAHLHKIPDDLTIGQEVDASTVIGYVGNTGTSYSVDNQPDLGLHLHQDLLIYGQLFWKPYSPTEVQQILRSIWD